MEKTTLNIPNISCHHCINTIKNELSELAGVAVTDGNVKDKTVTIEWGQPATLEKIKKQLQEINYPAT